MSVRSIIFGAACIASLCVTFILSDKCTKDKENLMLVQNLLTFGKSANVQELRNLANKLMADYYTLDLNFKEFARTCSCGNPTFVASGVQNIKRADLEKLDLTLDNYLQKLDLGTCAPSEGISLMKKLDELLAKLLMKDSSTNTSTTRPSPTPPSTGRSSRYKFNNFFFKLLDI